MKQPVLGPKHELTLADFHSATWQKMKKHLQSQLESYRKENDGNLDNDKTQRVRGRIAEVKRLLALEDPTPKVMDDSN